MKIDNLVKYIESDLNVLFSGPHGVGKTTMVIDAAKEAEIRLKYYSAATLDPWADLVGIPVPVGDDDNKFLKFIRPKDIEDAEIVFFDELNRSHPKVQNAVLEMIQFHSINGVKLPKLRMVWAAINPAGNKYKVDELDPALLDRFHIHLDVKANPDVKFFTRRDKTTGEQMFTEEEAEHLVSWWSILTKDAKAVVSPRRLQYFGELIKEGIHPKHGIPLSLGINIPVGDLVSRFNHKNSGKWNIEQIISSDIPKYQMYISSREKALEVSSEICSSRVTYIATSAGLPEKVLMLPKEIRSKMYNDVSFKARIKNKYSSSWMAKCPVGIKKMIVDSFNLGSTLVDFKGIEKMSKEVEVEVEEMHKQVLAAGKKMKNEIITITAPEVSEVKEELVAEAVNL